jgi:DNA-binding transcriptional ArsR family regulator
MTTISDDLDGVFVALANEHRREMVHALGLQPQTISQLARLRELSLPAIHKHVKLLEDAGLVTRTKVGRTNVLTLNRTSMRSMQDWLAQFQTHWGTDKATLENYEEYLTRTT